MKGTWQSTGKKKQPLMMLLHDPLFVKKRKEKLKNKILFHTCEDPSYLLGKIHWNINSDVICG